MFRPLSTRQSPSLASFSKIHFRQTASCAALGSYSVYEEMDIMNRREILQHIPRVAAFWQAVVPSLFR